MDPEVLKFREERNRRIQEALANQPRMTVEEVYAQYDRKMGITPRTFSTDDEEQKTDTTTEEEMRRNR